MPTNNKISLKYLFMSFLKIGSVSWGGFMALISVVQKQMVERDQVVEEEMLLDGISLASVLPGPVAFNVIAYLGYQLRGIKGALVSMIAIILPSFFMILALAVLYARYGEIPVLHKFFLGILPAISAIIISVAITMARKQITDYKQAIICILTGMALIFIHSFFATLSIILISALFGYLLYFDSPVKTEEKKTNFQLKNHKTQIFQVAVSLLIIYIIWLTVNSCEPYFSVQFKLLQTIFFTFSGMSLTLFGGGYVIIPVMQQIIVDGLHWLTIHEFSDAIAMGQITPGPIFISATFIGYRIAGVLGACVATAAIFFPPGIVMVIFSKFLKIIKSSTFVASIFKGMRPAIIGMIFSAAYTIGKGAVLVWPTFAIFLLALFLLIKFRINVVYLIPLSGIAGILLF